MPATKSKAKSSRSKRSSENVQRKPKAAAVRTGWPTEGWATFDEAAEFFQVCRRTVERLVEAGRLNKHKLGRNISRLDWSELRNFKPGHVEAHKV